MVPVVLPTTGVGMVPNAVPGIIVVDGIIVAVLPAMEGETVAGTVDGVGTEVEVHDGVKPGDQVILNPMVNLAEGSKVAVRKTQAS